VSGAQFRLGRSKDTNENLKDTATQSEPDVSAIVVGTGCDAGGFLSVPHRCTAETQ
jgi:hypothetical protein